MASISSETNGKRIQFVDSNCARKSVWLGDVDKRTAEGFRLRVEKIINSRIAGSSPDDETSRWIAALGDKMHARLATAGLVEGRASMALGAFADAFIAERGDVKPATATVFGHTRRCLVGHFGAEKPLRSFNQGDADRWRAWLAGEGLAEATIGRRCGIAKQIFRAALRRKLIDSNPFADLKSRVRGNKGREYFLSRSDAAKISEACPNVEWRLIFALSRYGGLRCPSEHLGLKWADVDWQRGRMLIHSPKTEHHEGKETRWLPIFPELRGPLLEVFEQAEPGTIHVINRYRSVTQNLRTQFERIIKRAGLIAWPKLFHNLRATRQTELASEFPIHVVCAWLGNSRAVAQEHYLQVTDSDFQRASAPATAETLRVPQRAVSAGTGVETSGSETPEMQNRPELPSDSGRYLPALTQQMGDTGLEPVTSSVSGRRASQLR